MYVYMHVCMMCIYECVDHVYLWVCIHVKFGEQLCGIDSLLLLLFGF